MKSRKKKFFDKKVLGSFFFKDYFKYFVKLCLVFLIVWSLFFLEDSEFSNKIGLLAVNEDGDGNIDGGSLIDLSLTIKRGSGQIFINLDNSIKDIDTQISIINSQKIACILFNLDCSKFDFYYDFDGGALLLKGPSASSAIAILTAKTINHQKINSGDVVITGSLNSGGLIGVVGGVDEKIDTAERLGFEKVLIPIFSEYNKSKKREIEVIEILDLVEAYNNFNGDEYFLKSGEIQKVEYQKVMMQLSSKLCERSYELREKVPTFFENGSELKQYLDLAERSLNSSIVAYENQNYYSQGSFCYNANINYRVIYQSLLNLSNEELRAEVSDLKQEIDGKFSEIKSSEYLEKIETVNDFYVYLILNNRLNEAKEFLEKVNLTKEKVSLIDLIGNGSVAGENEESGENSSFSDVEVLENGLVGENVVLYSFAKERFFTVFLWENLIEHSGSRISFDRQVLSDACFRINRELAIKNELLSKYGVLIFEEDLKKQNLNQYLGLNDYLCLYNGFEILGRMNTVLNSVGISKNDTLQYTEKILNFTKSRISLNSNGDFPLIPYIYFEYASDLYKTESDVAILYLNYALAYSDLNIYLEDELSVESYVNYVEKELFDNYLFVFALLLILAFW